MRRPLKYKKTDVVRASKAVRAAGYEIARWDFTSDGFTVVPGKPNADGGEHNEWDELISGKDSAAAR